MFWLKANHFLHCRFLVGELSDGKIPIGPKERNISPPLGVSSLCRPYLLLKIARVKLNPHLSSACPPARKSIPDSCLDGIAFLEEETGDNHLTCESGGGGGGD